MGQRGLLDRLLVAHTTPITSIAWREPPGTSGSETGVNGMGWFASGGLDRCVKVNTLEPPRIAYSLHGDMGFECIQLRLPYTGQTNLHAPSTIPCSTCSMATRLRM